MKTNSTRFGSRHRQGSVLVVALASLAVLAFVAGLVLQVAIPRHNTTYQVAAWQEARLAAEAGLDRAMRDIKANLGDPTKAGSWDGWKTGGGGASATGGQVFAIANATNSSPILAGGFHDNFKATDSIYWDNFDVSPSDPTAPRAVADVEVWGIYPDAEGAPESIWYRVRSLGTSAISGGKEWAPVEKFDASLRKLSLKGRRTQITSKDRGASQLEVTGTTPTVSRIIEVLVRPTFAYSKAILTEGLLTTGNSNNYEVDSYDSRKGPYDASQRGEDGDIASNGKHVPHDGQAQEGDPFDIYVNNADIYGNVDTNHHWVDEDSVIVPSAYVKDNGQVTGESSYGFYQELPMPTVPTPPLGYSWTDVSGPETIDSSAGSVQYLRTASLGAFTVTGTAPTKVVLYVTGDWNTGSGNNSEVIIPDNVKVEIYVEGDIDLGNGDINKTPDGAIGRPANLQVYGLTTGSEFSASGNPEMSLTFYGPGTDITYKGGGNGAWYGAVVANSYDLSGGGNAGFHYDTSLANQGKPIGYVIASYYESSRE